jgi:hypothetical protein
VLAATYLQYVSLDLRQTALHLGAFEQPGEWRVLRNLPTEPKGRHDE